MGDDTLVRLAKKTQGSGEDLTMLVRQLGQAAEPLEGKFNGQARAAFDRFKGRTDEIAVELTSALAAVLGGVVGMEKAFAQGDVEGADGFAGSEGSANFDAARFGGGR
ncbi:hypothetical protein [Myceligenerans crystallogenes]